MGKILNACGKIGSESLACLWIHTSACEGRPVADVGLISPHNSRYENEGGDPAK